MACVFFFQAEDGIRDDLVTGVQTCALPISAAIAVEGYLVAPFENESPVKALDWMSSALAITVAEIGRASCRERVEMSGGGVSVRKGRRERKGQTKAPSTW